MSNFKKVANYTISNEILGSGSFGKVQKAWKDLPNGEKEFFACKIICKKTLSPQLMEKLSNEVKILKSLNQGKAENIVKLFDVQKSPNNFYLFFEFCNATDLENLKNARKRFSEQEAWNIIC